MSRRLAIAIECIQYKAALIEKKISEMTENPLGCANCGFLTQEDLDHNQEVNLLVSELTTLTEALDYLEEMTK